MYKLLRPILFRVQPETMHNTMASVGKVLSPLAWVLSLPFTFEDPSLEIEVFGTKFKNPVGLAPGYDKSGKFSRFMAALGFGFIEVGSITPVPQPGNPKPRLFRLDADEAIVNRMGFNSVGMKIVAENLRRLQNRDFVVGVNLGKNKTTPNEEALRDYQAGFSGLSEFADYIVINVSSPNTPGLRQLQDKEPLTKILKEIQILNFGLPKSKAVLLKIAPDLTDGQLDDIAAIARETKIDGIIAANTTVSRDGLKTSKEQIEKIGEGGVSGRPVRDRVTKIIAYLYKKLEGQVPIIGAGGIFSAEDAYEKIRAGASLVEIYTGMVYEGPMLIKNIKKGLVRLLKNDGFGSVREAVGAAHR